VISRGSLEEVRYLLLLSEELSFLPKVLYDDLENRCEEVSKMLNALINSLRKKNETFMPRHSRGTNENENRV